MRTQGEIITAIFIFLIVLVVIVFDIWVLLTYGQDATISRVIRQANTKWPPLGPLLAFAAGCVLGHMLL